MPDIVVMFFLLGVVAMLAALGITFPLNVLFGIPIYANLLGQMGLG